MIQCNTEKFEAFVWYHLAHFLKFPIGEFHRGLIELTKNSRLAVAAPRSFAKSTYFSFFYPLFMALENPGIKIMLLSATGDLADSLLANIRRELESNVNIIEWYGEQAESKGKKWTSQRLELANGSYIFAKGAGKQIRGFRPDIVIGDDLETDEMVISLDQRAKFDHWFWTDVMGTLKAECQLIVVGTILHPESFLASMLEEPRSGWETRFYQAVKDYPSDNLFEGESIWPEMWPINMLKQRHEEMGHYQFMQEYMNDPIPDEFRTFQKEWFNYFDDEPYGCNYYVTIDPAIEITDKSDMTAIVVCAVDSAHNYYVLEYINRRLLPSETVELVFQLQDKYNPSKIGIEKNGFQRMLRYDIKSKCQERNIYPKVIDLDSGGRRKQLRIEALQPRYEAGKIFHRKGMDELETQLLRFPSSRCKDDLPDALAYQLDIAKKPSEVKAPDNPYTFHAIMHRRKQKAASPGIWGNQNIRGIH